MMRDKMSYQVVLAGTYCTLLDLSSLLHLRTGLPSTSAAVRG